jgi:hypothetical protein
MTYRSDRYVIPFHVSRNHLTGLVRTETLQNEILAKTGDSDEYIARDLNSVSMSHNDIKSGT